MRRFVLLLAACAASVPALAAGQGEPGTPLEVRVELRNRIDDLKLLDDLRVDVDGVYGTWARVYVLPEELDKLRYLGLTATELPKAEIPAVEPDALNQYHTYETLTTDLQQIAAAYPGITRLVSLGKSVQGRDLWAMKITDDPSVDEDEPEVRYIAAMHGDEVVGKEMCFDLIDLLTSQYGTDPRITSLVDSTEIWIVPSMNPDGTALQQRYNANGYDLNRNFPDQWVDPNDTASGRQPETQRVMTWALDRNFSLSANFHGGSVVANYPFDSTSNGVSTYALAPEDAAFVSLARTYADANPTMFASNSDPSFDRGICNGSDWYAIHGGMQDWAYVFRGGKELTLEISSIKWPNATNLPGFWTSNQESMLRYLERGQEGVRGIVRDASTGTPIRASVAVSGLAFPSWSDPAVGDFHRVLLPGRYDLTVSAPGYASAVVRDVDVEAGLPATRADLSLWPLDVRLDAESSRWIDGGDGVAAAGETADLAVTLRDLGAAATGIAARLVPTTPFAVVERDTASFPDLATGAAAESIAPHFSAAVDPSVPPGHALGFAVEWSADPGSGTAGPFFLPVGGATCQTVASADVPRSILDRSTASSTLSFPTVESIASARVRVDITHPYIGDLHVKVVTPRGTPVALHARTGGSADNIVGWFPTDRPSAEPLARISAEDAAGTWTLVVNDGVPANTGTLNGWSLEICGRPIEAQTPEMVFRSVARSGSGAALTWWPYPGVTSYRVYRSTTPAARATFTDVTAQDPDPTDTSFDDPSSAPVVFYLVTGVGPAGESAR